MNGRPLPSALAHKLGYEATSDLVAFVDHERDEMLSLAAERFERRLTQEISGLRVDVVREVHAIRVDLFKWSFLFWIGQVAAMIGVLAFMLRSHG